MTVLTKSQFRTYTKTFGRGSKIVAVVRHDDRYGNGHNTFSITGTIYEYGREVAGGCIHEEIARHFPQLAPLIKYHLCSTDGPLHYIENTLFHADGHGPTKGWLTVRGTLAGEPVSGIRYGNLADILCVAERFPKYCTVKVDESTAKRRDLNAARSSAVWPEATDDDLTLPGLRERLEARLPQLMADFRAAVESLGFVY